MARYSLKYCLRGSLSPKQPTYQPATKHRYRSKREVTCQFGQEYLSLVHDVLVLFMFFLMADSVLALNYVIDRFCGGYLVRLAYCDFAGGI